MTNPAIPRTSYIDGEPAMSEDAAMRLAGELQWFHDYACFRLWGAWR